MVGKECSSRYCHCCISGLKAAQSVCLFCLPAATYKTHFSTLQRPRSHERTHDQLAEVASKSMSLLPGNAVKEAAVLILGDLVFLSEMAISAHKIISSLLLIRLHL